MRSAATQIEQAHFPRRAREMRSDISASAHVAGSAKTFAWVWYNASHAMVLWLGALTQVAFPGQYILHKSQAAADEVALRWTERALLEASAGRLAAAYDIALLELDSLIAANDWERTARALEVIVDDNDDVDLGVGVMRFASMAKAHISDWQELLERLSEKLEARGESAATAMRGL